MSETIKIYGNSICPYSQRSVISLLELGIDFDFVDIDFIKPPNWLYNISPLNTIPVLETSNSIIYHSSAIIEYLNEIALNKLLPYDARNNALIRSICSYIDHLHSLVKECISSAESRDYLIKITNLEKELEILFTRILPADYNVMKLDMIRVYLTPLLILINTLDKHGPINITMNKRGMTINEALLNMNITKALNNTEYIESVLRFIFTTDTSTINYLKGN